MAGPEIRLTKSQFLLGARCAKALWLRCHMPEEAETPSETDLARIERGRDVELDARREYPDLAEPEAEPDARPLAQLEATRVALAEARPTIEQAAFLADGFFARCDFLVREPNGWRIVEVKSAGAYDKKYATDLAYQMWVAEKAGLSVVGATLRHVDYAGEPRQDARYAFQDHDATAEARALVHEVALAAEALAGLRERFEYPPLGGEPPHADPDLRPACRGCEYFAHCADRVPSDHLFFVGLHHSRFKKLMEAGVRLARDVPSASLMPPEETLRLRAVQAGRAVIGPSLREDLALLRYPAFFLDFETARPPTAELRGVPPNGLAPFQWSCHRLDAPPWPDGAAQAHEGFIHQSADDPAAAFAASLAAALGEEGSIVHYASHERSVLRELAERDVPGAVELWETVEPRMVDLEAIVKRGYADPRFRGRSSIKAVLPALVPELTYDDLEIHGGDAAQAAWLEAVRPGCPADRREAIFLALSRYCERDTWAMVRIVRALLRAAAPEVGSEP